MKNKSSVKGRFKLKRKKNPENGTKIVVVRAGQAGKRHGMTKRPKKMIRNARGTTELAACDAKIVAKYTPYI